VRMIERQPSGEFLASAQAMANDCHCMAASDERHSG
jgi:hypothetical protein